MQTMVVCSRMLTTVETVWAVHQTFGLSIPTGGNNGICDFEPPASPGLSLLKRKRLMIVADTVRRFWRSNVDADADPGTEEYTGRKSNCHQNSWSRMNSGVCKESRTWRAACVSLPVQNRGIRGLTPMAITLIATCVSRNALAPGFRSEFEETRR